MRLGTNVWNAFCGSTALPFCDMMTGSGGWTNVPAGTTWPFQGALPPKGNNMLCNGYWPAGTYTITCGGTGKVAIPIPGTPGGTYTFAGANESYPVSVPAANAGQFTSFMGLPANSATDPLHDLHVYPPGGGPGPLWHPGYLASLKPFTILRSMDWLQTNGSRIAKWSDRVVRPGFEVEGFLDLCNQVGADPWLNLPHLCSSATGVTDYPAQLGTLIAQVVPPHRTVYLEYSNETWNYSIGPQGGYCLTQSQLIVDPTTGKPYGAAWGEVKAYGWLATQAFNAVAQAVGTGGPRLVRVFAGCVANYGGTLWPAVQSVGPQLGWPVDALATAPYTGWPETAPWTTLTLQSLAAAGDMNDAITLYCQGIEQYNPTVQANLLVWSNAAKALGIPLLYYEFDVAAPSIWKAVPAVTLAARSSPRFAQCVRAHLDMIAPFAEAGCQFLDCATGVWGARQHADDNANQHYQALTAFARQFN